MANNSEFPLDPSRYVAFDASSLKSHIIDTLTKSKVFTDQVYTGSNINAIIEIIAYAFHTLLFYQNQAGSEAVFGHAQLYENANRIVKALNYNPVGYQTAILAFQANATAALPAGSYTIPRYTYFTLNGNSYSFNQDVTFVKTAAGSELLVDLANQTVLYQGSYIEYPTYTATGEPYEILTITLVNTAGSNTPIDHFNIDVYVKDNTAATPVYVKYTSTQSLFLESQTATKYEIRLNENGRYEIKFGNGVFGKKINQGDEVAVYFLKTAGTAGEVGAGVLNNNTAHFYTSSRFDEIIDATLLPGLTLISSSQMAAIEFKNSEASTGFQDIENVDSIWTNAVNTFRSQYRLVTVADFQGYISNRFSGIISSVKVVNNSTYISGHLKYYFDQGVETPSIESRVAFNQVKFGTSCAFNNVYVYAVPRFVKTTSLTSRVNYLNPAQKKFIAAELNDYKIATSEVVFADPVYIQVDLAVKSPGETATLAIADETYLEITADATQIRNFDSIKAATAQVFIDFFKTTKDNLGCIIDLNDITTQILSIAGVSSIRTVRSGSSVTVAVPGISLLLINPVYPKTDVNIIQQNVQLPYYKYPYLNNAADFVSKIKVITHG